MDLTKLHHCLVVAELGSFTRAASQLAVPQSVLSRQVRDVEDWLRLRLLHRTGRGAVLTESGERMLPLLRCIVADGDRLLDQARALQHAPSGTVRLGVLTSLSQVLLTPLLNLAGERLPEVRIQVMEGLTEHLDELLVAGRIDLGLLYNNRQAPAPTDEALLLTDVCLIGAPGDRLTQADTIDLVGLAGLPLTLPALPNRLRLTIDQACREHSVTLNVITTLDAIGTMKDIAASGRTYTLLPLHFVAADIAAGRLQAARIVN
ncbi:MAG TPA: LysR family transcriptional regulator, partial [Candidatus Sulfotelmatobacter sp.]|nr:LysR family transcriptional regulator [Candidatus Sulfotelmatobacter sp.]